MKNKESNAGRPKVDDPKIQKSIRIKESNINKLIEDFGSLSKAIDELIKNYLKGDK